MSTACTDDFQQYLSVPASHLSMATRSHWPPTTRAAHAALLHKLLSQRQHSACPSSSGMATRNPVATRGLPEVEVPRVKIPGLGIPGLRMPCLGTTRGRHSRGGDTRGGDAGGGDSARGGVARCRLARGGDAQRGDAGGGDEWWCDQAVCLVLAVRGACIPGPDRQTWREAQLHEQALVLAVQDGQHMGLR